MNYQRFEDLPVWQDAADLAAAMFDWTNQDVFRRKGDLANQIQRATLSISNPAISPKDLSEERRRSW